MVVDTTTNKVVGYVNAMPLEPVAFEDLQKGGTIDLALPLEAVRAYDFPDLYLLYVASVAVDPSYQSSTAVRVLLEGFIDKLLELARQEMFVSRILADATSAEGERLARLVGMTRARGSTHESAIYETTLLPPSLKFLSNKGRALITFYTKRYENLRDLLQAGA